VAKKYANYRKKHHVSRKNKVKLKVRGSQKKEVQNNYGAGEKTSQKGENDKKKLDELFPKGRWKESRTSGE